MKEVTPARRIALLIFSLLIVTTGFSLMLTLNGNLAAVPHVWLMAGIVLVVFLLIGSIYVALTRSTDNDPDGNTGADGNNVTDGNTGT